MIHGILEFTEDGYRILCEHVKAYEDIKPGELLAPYQDVLEALYANSCDNFFVGYIIATKLDKIGVGITDIVGIRRVGGWY